MSEQTEREQAEHARLRGAVIVGLIPGQAPKVVQEAARFARLFKVPLVVAYVDVTRFITYEDPDGYPHTAPINLGYDGSSGNFDAVQSEVTSALHGIEIEWTGCELVGDPALAMKDLAESVDASLLVVGTRKPGPLETIREFFTGSVAARLAHRQSRNVLVVPLGTPLADDAPFFPEG